MGVPTWLARLLGRPPAPAPRPPLIAAGRRVRLRQPLAGSHRVWIQAGAVGIVIGWDAGARQVSVELDAPRTVVTVPWSWVEDEETPPAPPRPAPAPRSTGWFTGLRG